MVNEIVKKNGVSYGVITGVVSILITTSLYVIDLELFTSMWTGFVSIAIFLIIGIMLLSKTKKDLNGQLSFKEAFTTYFISAVIGILISVAFNIILFNFIDPSAKDIIRDNSIKYMVKTMEKFNAPASAINEAITKLKETDQFSIVEQLKGSIFSILFSAILGLILAAFFKSKPSSRE
jgi:hypothetical protein